MNERVRVPIRVKASSDGSKRDVKGKQRAVVDSQPSVVEQEPVSQEEAEALVSEETEAQKVSAAPRVKVQEEQIAALEEDLETWRDRALRLQAEIENFRKRQRRLAEDRIEANRVRLLRSFLMVADDLERALRAEGDQESLRDGVEVTYRSLKQILKQEGVERIEAEGERFDPEWHEAVATVPHQRADVRRDTVVEVTQEGYVLSGRLLRPARVVVAR
jgi:molecular chaperone GrpE